MYIFRIFEDTEMEYVGDILLSNELLITENEFSDMIKEAKEKGFKDLNEIAVFLLTNYNFKEVNETSENIYNKWEW